MDQQNTTKSPIEQVATVNALTSNIPYPERGLVSDGYHTFDELYEHRIELFLALCKVYYYEEQGFKEDPVVWMSRLHSDGSSWDGWFIMGMFADKGHQITYHLPDKYWDRAKEHAALLERAPEWDGHTAADVLERLKQL